MSHIVIASTDEAGTTTLDVPALFSVAPMSRRSGDPTTEELHAGSLGVRVKRFNDGKSYGLRQRTATGDDAFHVSSLVAAHSPNTLLETDTHTLVRAGVVPAAVGAQASSASSCSGRVLSHGWAFLVADGSVFAWEQGMVVAERAGAATGADQSVLRFDHPTMADELAQMEALEVPVEAADLVVLSPPWEASGGKRELLLMSPSGLARYWPDLHSPRRFTHIDLRKFTNSPGQLAVRVTVLGPADFGCGLSLGGVVRVRPGLANPCLLTETSSVLSQGFGIVKKVGSFIGRNAFYSTAAIPRSPTAAGQPSPPCTHSPGHALTAANGSVTSNKSPVVSLSVVLPGMQISRTRGAAASPSPTRLLRLTTESLEVWSLQVAAGGPEAGAGKVSGGAGNGTQSLEVRHPLLRNVQAALGGGRKVCLLDLVVAGDVRTVSVAGGDAMATLSGFEMEVLVLAAAVAVDGGGLGEQMGDFSLHLVRISSAEASWVGSSGSVKLLSSHTLPGGPAITSSTKPLPRATLVTDKEAFLSPIAGEGKVGSPVRAHVFWPASGDGGGQDGGGMAASVFSVTVWTGGEAVHWQDGGTMQVSSLALFGGCIGGGPALVGCPGVMLLSAQGQTVWVVPRAVPTAGGANGRAVDLEAPSTLSGPAVQDWKTALLNGLCAYDGGASMDKARASVVSLLRRDAVGGAGRGNLDAAIVEAGLEVLNGSWREPAAFSTSHQLIHLALREKIRRHRALVGFLLDSGAWGSATFGRAALAEHGEKVAAAGRLCELQDAISRNDIGVKAAGLLESCMRLALDDSRTDDNATVKGPGNGGKTARDHYFARTERVMDALLQLHTPSAVLDRFDLLENAPSFGVSSASTLQRYLADNSQGVEARIALLNQLSVVVAGVFEAALRYRASERNLYCSGTRGKMWTASDEARTVLFGQLKACNEAVEAAGPLQNIGRAESDVMRGAIGRLSVLLLDGFKEEEEAYPAASVQIEWQAEYTASKEVAVRACAACGREDLARALADKHRYFEGIVELCHSAEMRQPGCEHGHRLLRARMAPPSPAQTHGYNRRDDADNVEGKDARVAREQFARFVLDWHLRRQLKTALLDVGAAVPEILCEFLADWREAELLWVFQLRLEDYTGARHALAHGIPPPESKGGRCRTQHLWLSLAKLANQAGGVDAACADSARGADIQRRLELAEVRQELIKLLPQDVEVPDQSWTWQEAFTESVAMLNDCASSQDSASPRMRAREVAHVAFQGYKALVAGLPEGSAGRADKLWKEVVGVTLNDPLVGEAVARDFMPAEPGDHSNAKLTDREMEAVWKRQTALHLLLRAIEKDRRRRREIGARDTGEGVLDLTDESLQAMVHELMPAAADGRGATCEAWVSAIRKCPW